MNLSKAERDALVDIIDGTIDSMDEVEGAEFRMWIRILNKLGPRGVSRAREWTVVAQLNK